MELVQEREAQHLADTPQETRWRLRDHYARPLPETIPAYGGAGSGLGWSSGQDNVHVDTEGNLWVLEYNEPGQEHNRWSVFDTSGRLLGTLQGLDFLDILDIGGDFIVGRTRDELDVQSVRVHQLVKSG